MSDDRESGGGEGDWGEKWMSCRNTAKKEGVEGNEWGFWDGKLERMRVVKEGVEGERLGAGRVCYIGEGFWDILRWMLDG